MSLTISRCSFDFQDERSVDNFKECDFPQLRVLKMQGLSGLDDASFRPLISKCHGGLEVLDISSCFNVTATAIAECITDAELCHLKELGLHSCEINDATVALLVRELKDLQRVDLSNTPVSGKAIAGFIDKSVQNPIRFLAIRSCEKVSQQAIELLKHRHVTVDYARHQKERGAKRLRYF